MLNDKRSRSQSITYKVLYVIVLAATIIGTVFSFDLYLNEYDSELALFEKCATFYAYVILSALVIAFCIVVLLLKNIFSCAKKEISGGILQNVFVNSFCGIFCVAYPIVMLFEKIHTNASINYITLIVAAVSLLGSLYFFFNMAGLTNKKNTIAFFGLCFAVFCVLIIFTVHYNSSNILITSPVRIGSLLSYISIMLYVLAEIRFIIGSCSHSMFLSMGAASVFFCISSSLPKLYLTLMGESGFSFDSGTILLAIELLCGIYAAVRMSVFVSSKNFSAMKSIDEEKEEMYEIITEIGLDTFENHENDKNDNEGDSQDIERIDYRNDNLIVSDKELPDDVGFDGGKEGTFVVEDYETIENDTDDDFESDEISPFDDESIEDSIQKAIDEGEDEGEFINYEKMKNLANDNSKNVSDVSDFNVVDNSQKEDDLVKTVDSVSDEADEEEEIDIDDDIDEDVGRLIDELVHKKSPSDQEIDKQENKKFKFRFVKKM